MQVELSLAPSSARRWHLELALALAAVPGVEVAVRWDGADVRDRRLERLLALERRRGAPGRSSPESTASFSGFEAGTDRSDLAISLSSLSPPARSRTWRLTFDAVEGVNAALAAVVAGRTPLVRLVDSEGRTVAEARPGSESPGVAEAAFDDLLAGCTTLIVQAVSGNELSLPTQDGVEDSVPVAPERRPSPLLVSAARMAVGSLARRGYHALYRAPHWRVGWRYVDGADVVDLRAHPESGWTDLPDDGYHFYADPFPFVAEDRTFLFVEDFDHRVGRGVISVVEYDESGPLTAPTPVLQHDVHLSYPCVLEDEGEIWMVPETSAAGTVELYRAVGFPHRWRRERVLLRDLDASDATPFRHQGRWWLTATVRDGGSCSDALYLWHADHLVGPWRPHARNPVLLDITSARPAGRVVHRDGRLFRPVQDGSGGYGRALAIAEVTRLDEGCFEQRVVARLGTGPRWAGRRLHTLNRAGRLECIDGSAMSPRVRRRA